MISHHDSSFLPSDPSLRTSLGLLPETCCFLPDLLCGFFLHPPGTAPSGCPRLPSLLLPFGLGPSERRATELLPDPGGAYPRFTQFLLLSIFSIARLPFPITPIRNRVRPPLSPSPLLTFVINWSDQHLNRCFLISRRAYIFQRTSSPSYKLE